MACTLANAGHDNMVRCPFRADQFRRQNRLLTYRPVNGSPLAPPSVTGSFTPDFILRCCPASAQSMKPAAWFSRPSTDLPLFLIPHPLRFEIGLQISRSLRLTFPQSLRPVCLFRDSRRGRTPGLSGHLDCPPNFRPANISVGLLPICRHDLRHAV